MDKILDKIEFVNNKHIMSPIENVENYISTFDFTGENGIKALASHRELRSVEDFVYKVVCTHGIAIKYATVELKNNVRIATAAVNSDPNAIQYVGTTLLRDFDFGLQMVTKNAKNLEFLDFSLRSNMEIVKAATSRCAYTLKYASDELRADKNLVKSILEYSGCILAHVDSIFKSNIYMVLTALNCSASAVQFACLEFRDDPIIALLAVFSRPLTFQYLGTNLKNDKTFVKYACKLNGTNLKFTGLANKNDKEIIDIACAENSEAIFYAGEYYRKQHELDLREKASNKLNKWSTCKKRTATYNDEDGTVILPKTKSQIIKKTENPQPQQPQPQPQQPQPQPQPQQQQPQPQQTNVPQIKHESLNDVFTLDRFIIKTSATYCTMSLFDIELDLDLHADFNMSHKFDIDNL